MTNVQQNIDKPSNVDLGKTQITDNIRVSSAAIFYDSPFGNYYQFETWIFSEDKEHQKSRQIIHACASVLLGTLVVKTKRIHERIASGLKEKFKCEV